MFVGSVTAGTMEVMNDDHAALGARIDRTNELLQRMLAEVAKTPSTHAIFVDAGYLYAAAGRLVAGTEDRRAFDLDAEGLIDALIDRARTIFADSRLLRVWTGTTAHAGRIHTAEQQTIAELPDVKVRLGNLNANNQQKGVDSLIRSDLESLARHRAIERCRTARRRRGPGVGGRGGAGVRGAGPPLGYRGARGPQPGEPLLWEVDDSQRTFDLEFFKPYVSRRTSATYDPTAASRPSREERPGGSWAPRSPAKWLAARGREALVELLPGHPYLPGSVDQDLLVEAEGLLAVLPAGPGGPAPRAPDGFWEHLQAQY